MDWAGMISTLGFPIVCVIGLAGFCYKGFVDITEANKERESKMYQMLGESQEMLAKLTEINATFVSTLEDQKASLETLQDDVAEIRSLAQIMKKNMSDEKGE